MKGIPTFSKNTQVILDTLEGKEIKEFPTELLGSNKDMYTLFSYLAKNNFLAVIQQESGNYFSWCWDVRFNYRDREVVLPYFSYDVTTKKAHKVDLDNKRINVVNKDDKDYSILRYNLDFNLYVIDEPKNNYRLASLLVYNYVDDILYNLELTDLPYFSSDTFSVEELLDKYTNYKYRIKAFDKTGVDLNYSGILAKYSREVRQVLSSSFELFKTRMFDYNYRDVRVYDVDPFSEEATLIDDSRYVDKRIDFEALMYCIFAGGALPYEDTYKGMWAKLGVTARFITIGGKDPLTLKYYYTNKPKNFKRRTYERFFQ